METAVVPSGDFIQHDARGGRRGRKKEMTETIVTLEGQLKGNRFTMDNVSDKDIVFYTGMPSRRVLIAC
jgi:hypothetical protein